jgi:uncharacterized membrane protein YedE/YeeE
MSPRTATFTALAVFASLLLTAAVGYGIPLGYSAVFTTAETGLVASMILGAKSESNLPRSAKDFVTGAGWSVVIFGLMFGFDCGVAFLSESEASFVGACMRHPNIGVFITAFVFAAVVGMYLVCLFRSILLRVVGHDG